MVRQNTQSCSSTSLSRNSFCTSATGHGSVSAEWLRLPRRRAMNRCNSPGSRSSMKVSPSSFTVIGITAIRSAPGTPAKRRRPRRSPDPSASRHPRAHEAQGQHSRARSGAASPLAAVAASGASCGRPMRRRPRHVRVAWQRSPMMSGSRACARASGGSTLFVHVETRRRPRWLWATLLLVIVCVVCFVGLAMIPAPQRIALLLSGARCRRTSSMRANRCCRS
ncbi:hypothetical protein RLIN73S_05626 [Rhodanobacter lindaniclasticus]